MWNSPVAGFHYELRKGKTRTGCRVKSAKASSSSGVKAVASGVDDLEVGEVPDDGVGLGLGQLGECLPGGHRGKKVAGEVESEFTRDQRYGVGYHRDNYKNRCGRVWLRDYLVILAYGGQRSNVDIVLFYVYSFLLGMKKP
jgi:hypothetical protein